MIKNPECDFSKKLSFLESHVQNTFGAMIHLSNIPDIIESAKSFTPWISSLNFIINGFKLSRNYWLKFKPIFRNWQRKRMPHYKITYTLKGKRSSGVRELDNPDVEVAYNHFYKKTTDKFGDYDIKNFDCVKLSKKSPDYLKWIANKQKKNEK